MRNDILERKIARIIAAIAEERSISEEQALDFFYSTDTYRQLVDSETGLRLMSDGYILEDVRQASANNGHAGRVTLPAKEEVKAKKPVIEEEF